ERLGRHLERQRRGGPQLRYVPADGPGPEDRHADGGLAPHPHPRARSRLHPSQHPAPLRNSQRLLPPTPSPSPKRRGGAEGLSPPLLAEEGVGGGVREPTSCQAPRGSAGRDSLLKRRLFLHI